MSTAVVFDMDGTLLYLPVDIEEARLRLARLFSPYGVSEPFRPILQRLHEAARWAGQRGGDAEALEGAGRQILDDFELAAAAKARPTQGAREVLAALSGRSILLGLLTDNGRACVGPALAHAGLAEDAFSTIITRDDVAVPKPDPEGLRLCHERLKGAEIRWYVGDHAKDMQAGRAAHLPGCRLAAVRGKRVTDDDLLCAGAEHLLDELGAVLALPGLVQVL